MPFVRDFEDDPLAKRVYLVVFGPGKIGKTRSVLALVTEHSQYVFLMSVDGGILHVRQNPKLFKGKLGTYIEKSWTLKNARKNLSDAGARVKALTDKGVPPEKIWVVLDTATHLQTTLLAEARKVVVGKGHGKELASMSDEYEREMVTQVDYQVNLGHMAEIADALAGMPCNIVVICLDKAETKGRDKTGVMLPALSGGAYTRITGDADAVLRLVKEGDERVFRTFVAGGDSGDRSGNLDPSEPADLKHIQRKMLGLDTGNESEQSSGDENAEASPS